MRWAQGIKDEEDSASPWGVPGVTEETDTEQRTTVIEYEKCSSARGLAEARSRGTGCPEGGVGSGQRRLPGKWLPGASSSHRVKAPYMRKVF